MGNKGQWENGLGELFDQRAIEYGDKMFAHFTAYNDTISYQQMNMRTNCVANALRSLGIRKGDKICLFLPNCPELIYTWFAAAKLGAIYVPLNTSHKGNVLQYQLNDSDAKLLVVEEKFLDNIKMIEGMLDKIKTVIFCGRGESQKSPLKLDSMSFQELLGYSAENPNVSVSHSDIMAILYTSGTEGPSKGVLRSYDGAFQYATEFMKGHKLTFSDTIYTPMPLYHVLGGWCGVLPTVLAGCSIVISERFSISNFWNEIRKYKATVAHAHFTVIPMMAKLPACPDDRNHVCRSIHAAKMNEEFEKKYGVVGIETYGSTETGIVANYVIDQPRKRGAAGTIVPDYEVQIFDDNDNPLPFGKIGEIVVRPKVPGLIMPSYHKKPKETVEVFRNLWYHTGDRGYVDEEGYLFFVDRKKQMIRRRGENISAYEVEEVVNKFHGVLECAAVGVPENTGIAGDEDVKVVVVLQEGIESISPIELLDFCEKRMAYFMVPRYIEFKKSLPKNAIEKIEKYKLVAEGVSANTWDREKAGYRLKR